MKKMNLLQLRDLSASLFCLLLFNFSFFKAFLTFYPPNSLQDIPFFISIIFALFLAQFIIIHFLSIFLDLFFNFSKHPLLFGFFYFIIFFLSAMAAYSMDSFGIPVDKTMVLNLVKSNPAEITDLFNGKLFLYLSLAILCSIFLSRLTSLFSSHAMPIHKLRSRLFTLGACLLFFLLNVFSFTRGYATFFREHKYIRYFSNPSYWIYSSGAALATQFSSSQKKFSTYGTDAIIPPSDHQRELVIMVVGETARSDHFSLNGYQKKTNPLLEGEEGVLSFKDVMSCGTATAISVPCIFTHFGRDEFSLEKAAATDNLLDVLKYTHDIDILWRDNNSNSKGIGDRNHYQDFKDPIINSQCDPECRDTGMLIGLQEYINRSKSKDIFIVLHQMGSHGPAYFKRTPPSFQKFKPMCQTSDLNKCTQEEISNAYDNTILYTDFFLSETIQLLKKNRHQFNVALFYVSDHGESLGENNIYLHSLPYFIAPKEQKHVPLIMWFGGNYNKMANLDLLKGKIDRPFNHDYVYHTILGLFEIKTSVYRRELDLLGDIYYND
jgi:lipid A ethanolaminephosphotransferase